MSGEAPRQICENFAQWGSVFTGEAPRQISTADCEKDVCFRCFCEKSEKFEKSCKTP